MRLAQITGIPRYKLTELECGYRKLTKSERIKLLLALKNIEFQKKIKLKEIKNESNNC